MKLLNWIHKKIQNLLGITELQQQILTQMQYIRRLEVLTRNLVSIGVDVQFKRDPSMILIYSRLNGGQIYEVRANFKDMRELKDFVEQLNIGSIRTKCYTIPHHL
jgi:hypothetical protein